MKTINLKFLFVTVLLSCITLESCELQEYDIQIPESIFGKLNISQKDLTLEAKDGNIISFEYQVTDSKELIKLKTYVENDRYHSTLSYKNGELGWINTSVFDIDLQELTNKKNMNIIVEKHAKMLKKKFDATIVSRIADILEGIPELLYNELERKDYYNESNLSIFYHLAVFNTARRAYESRRSSDCQCEINHKYLSGTSPFFCAEDIVVSADWAYDLIKEKSLVNKIAGQQFIPKLSLKYLSGRSGQYISASKIDKLLKEELDLFYRKLKTKERQQIYNQNLTISKIPTITTRSEYDEGLSYLECLMMGVFWGTQCGCCGNYEGPCLLCSLVCLWHDFDCILCDKWYCGWDCKPFC
jgi:hypothetical protein